MMFGGTSICPKCSKAVYAAEQAMGPGRKLYHKPCLACMLCNKRLDSYTLLEHNEQPYCKACHLKHFGTPNLRHANLPATSPMGSPNGKRSTSPSSMPLKPVNTGTTGSIGPIPMVVSASTTGNGNVFPKLRPNRSLTSPTSPTFSRAWVNPISPSAAEPDGYESENVNANEAENGINTTIMEGEENAEPECQDDSQAMQVDTEPKTEDELVNTTELGSASSLGNASVTTSNTTTNTGRPGIGTIPRTVPLRHTTSRSVDISSFKAISANSTGTGSSTSASSSGSPTSFSFMQQPRSPTSPILSSFATGTRYGIALTGGVPSHTTGMNSVEVNNTGLGAILPSPTGGSPRKWGIGTPSCGRCGKSVYFAEQIKAAGKIYHKTCLRCVDCGTSLDSHKLRDHDGQPYCVRCYQKAYGPQGNGYALLGKAGG